MIENPTIAVDIRALVGQPSGIGYHTLSLMEHLHRRRSLRLVGMAHRPATGAVSLSRLGIEVESHGGPSGVVWQQLLLPRRLRRGDVDLLWSPLQTLPLWASVPCVATVHDLTALLFPETHSRKVRWSQILFLERSLERARRVVAVSQATARDLERHFPQCRDRLRVVPNGVDPSFSPASEEAIESIRHELRAPDGYVLYVGTLEPRKNLDTLLDAWEVLSETKVPLFLAGPWGWDVGPLERRLEKTEPGRIRHLGRLSRERLVRVMQGARLFVYPSLAEGFGLPPAEAMACGIPVVVSRTPSLVEVVGDAGLVVEATDSASLARALAQVLGSQAKARQMAEKGLQVVRRFSWENAAEALEGVFREVLAERESQPG